MKRIKIRLLGILFLSFIIFFQSCSVYHSKTVEAEEAEKSQTKVKLTTNNNAVYKFDRLEINQDSLYVFTGKKSHTAKKLGKLNSIKLYGKDVYFVFPKDAVKSIQLKNKSASIASSVLLGVAILADVVVILAALIDPVIDLSGWNFEPIV